MARAKRPVSRLGSFLSRIRTKMIVFCHFSVRCGSFWLNTLFRLPERCSRRAATRAREAPSAATRRRRTAGSRSRSLEASAPTAPIHARSPWRGFRGRRHVSLRRGNPGRGMGGAVCRSVHPRPQLGRTRVAGTPEEAARTKASSPPASSLHHDDGPTSSSAEVAPGHPGEPFPSLRQKTF